ncbi:unnamed protein product, partial [Mesorhabditis spiculigera]
MADQEVQETPAEVPTTTDVPMEKADEEMNWRADSPKDGTQASSTTEAASTNETAQPAAGETEKEPEKENSAPPPAAKEPAPRAAPTVPTRQYLDQAIVPILLQGLGALAKERPEDPITFLANFLLREKDKYHAGSSN